MEKIDLYLDNSPLFLPREQRVNDPTGGARKINNSLEENRSPIDIIGCAITAQRGVRRVYRWPGSAR